MCKFVDSIVGISWANRGLNSPHSGMMTMNVRDNAPEEVDRPDSNTIF